jgi:hypothetical protein
MFIQYLPTITHFGTSPLHSNLSSSFPRIPNLEHLRGDAHTAQTLALGRPMRIYYQDGTVHATTIRVLNQTVVRLGKSTGPSMKLRLMTLSTYPKLLPFKSLR